MNPCPCAGERPLHPLVVEARRDWEACTTEADVAKTGRLAAIFRDSGWSKSGVDISPKTNKPKDWCGMSVAAWGFRASMLAVHRRSFWATDNVRSFFSYGRAGRVHHRTAREVTLADGSVVEVAAWHAERKQERTWRETGALQRLPLAEWDLAPGDVALINHDGKTDRAHHIVLVESFDGATLTTLEGNATGLAPNGSRRRQGVVRVVRDLRVDTVRATIFGIGRFSPLDFSVAGLA